MNRDDRIFIWNMIKIIIGVILIAFVFYNLGYMTGYEYGRLEVFRRWVATIC